MYGFMQLEEEFANAKDIIEIYRTFPNNPVHFPGEEKLLRITLWCCISKCYCKKIAVLNLQ